MDDDLIIEPARKFGVGIKFRLAILTLGGLGLSGCYPDYGLGYAGYDRYECDPYDQFDSYYDCDYGYGFSNIGYGGGWYDNYYYPGYGIYIFDSYGHRHNMHNNHRRYWAGRRHDWQRNHAGRNHHRRGSGAYAGAGDDHHRQGEVANPPTRQGLGQPRNEQRARGGNIRRGGRNNGQAVIAPARTNGEARRPKEGNPLRQINRNKFTPPSHNDGSAATRRARSQPENRRPNNRRPAITPPPKTPDAVAPNTGRPKSEPVRAKTRAGATHRVRRENHSGGIQK